MYDNVITSDPVNRHHPLNQGKVLWLMGIAPLDGGQYWYDLCGKNHGILTNAPTWSQGNNNSASLSFISTSSQYVQVNDPNGQFDPGAGDYAFSFWIRTRATGTSVVIGKYNGGNDFWIGTLNKTTVVASFSGTGGNAQVNGTIREDEWNHVLGQRRGSSLEIYTNGILQNSASVGSATNSPGGYLGIGKFGQGLGFYINADLANVSGWMGRSLSAAEVQADYELSQRGYPELLNRLPSTILELTANNNGVQRLFSLDEYNPSLDNIFTPDPVNRHHPLNQGKVAWLNGISPLDGGQYIYDLTGLNHGTLVNTPPWTATPYGQGFTLNGSNQYIQAATVSSILASSTSAAIAVWCAPNGWIRGQSNSGFPFSTDSANQASHYPWIDGFVYNGVLRASRVDSITSLYPDSSWRRVLVYHGPSGWFMYENGRQTATASYEGSVSATVLNFGRSTHDIVNDYFFNGKIADLTAWSNPTLTPSELALADYELSQRNYPGVLNRQPSSLFALTQATSSYSASASGNALFGGTATVKVTYLVATSGNALFGNSAGLQLTCLLGSSGRGVFGGSAGVVCTYLLGASGNGVFGGTAPATLTLRYSASGVGVFGGTAPASETDNQPTFPFVGSGVAVFGGSAGVQVGYIYQGGGNAVFGGSATVTRITASMCLSAGLTVGDRLSGGVAVSSRLGATLAVSSRLSGSISICG